MSKSRRPRGSAVYLVQLTAQERDLLLSHVDPPDALDHLAPRTPQDTPVVTLQLDAEELAEFMVLFEHTANSAQDMVAMDRLTHAYARVESGLEGDVDPGAHLLRPAATTLGYTELQGQYLAFIFYYQKLHGRPPAESDLQRYFQVSPPTVHAMLKTLQRRRYIARTAGAARSIRLLVPPEAIPALA
ncbi:MAG: LexA family protein [Thermoleophilia bacterium]